MKLIFEIGMEEIPARFLEPTLLEIKTILENKFKENRIDITNLKTFGTPRRLVVSVEGISEMQKDLDITNMGPAKSVAYDANGNITKAALGFAKGQGAEEKDIIIVDTPKGQYIAIKKFNKGGKTSLVLPEILKETVLGINFPKSMKWADKKMKFARPIKWYLAMLDNEIVKFEIEGLTSGNKSNGHRFFGKDFEISNVDEYFTKIRENNVIIDIQERRELIKKLINETCVGANEKVLVEDELLAEVANLVEYPCPIVGTFNPDFLEVPQDVLIISMQVHQRYFPILNLEGKLQPKFVVVRNGLETSEFVRKGNEKVLSARLSDARFFYQEDLKHPLADNIEKLKSVVYQKDLGTIYDKVQRVKLISKKLMFQLDASDKAFDVFRVADLCKADLVSNMIGEKEFTKLQGIIGEDYALKTGENSDVAKGIREHYLPRFTGDDVPTGIEGAIVGLADRIDTLVGCFGVGLIPTGSKDPFALRRAALGIINIIVKLEMQITLLDLVEHSLEIYAKENILKRDKKEVLAEITEFLLQRIINVFSDLGYRKDFINAVLDSDNESIQQMRKKMDIIGAMYENPEFKKFLELIKRVGNIACECEEVKINPELITHGAEKELYNFIKHLEVKAFGVGEVAEHHNLYNLTHEHAKNMPTPKCHSYIHEILGGVDIIDRYFTEVMILDKNPEIKANRLSQMKVLDIIMNKVANFKLIENN